MRISTQHKDASHFDDLSKMEAYLASLACITREGKHVPEEYRHYLTAFQANPTTAAGRRMRLYLLKTGNSSTAAALLGKHSYDPYEGLNKNRVAYAFYVVTGNTFTSTQALMAGSVLDQTIIDNRHYRSLLSSLFERTKAEYEELSGMADNHKSSIKTAEDYVNTVEQDLQSKEEKLERIQTDMLEAERKALRTSTDTVSLENRAIKIVHPMRSIADLRTILTTPQTHAADIYITSGTDPDGRMIYDKLTMGPDGKITIQPIPETLAPDLLKDRDDLLTDMFERVYHRTGKDGNMELVRMEHGLNGSVMGKTGAISQDMIEQYMKITGKRAQDITACAGEYEHEITEQYGMIDDHVEICTLGHNVNREYESAKENMAHAVSELESFRSSLAEILRRARLSSAKLEVIKDTIEYTDNIIKIGQDYRARLDNGEFSDLEELLHDMPEELRQEFEQSVTATQNSIDGHAECAHSAHNFKNTVGIKGPNSMNSAWGHISAPHAISNGNNNVFVPPAAALPPRPSFA